jgi:hypothetical protein
MRRLARTPFSSIAIGVAVALTLAFASVALGYWSGTGTGTTSTRLADSLALTLSPATPDDPIAPGDRADVSVVVHNPNTFEAHMGSFVLDADHGPPFTVDSGHSGCVVSGGVLSFTDQPNGGAGWDIPPSVGSDDGTLVVQLRDALTMSVAAADACQGATFTITLDSRP